MATLVRDGLPATPKISVNAWRSAVLAAALAAGLCLTGWALAGFAGLAAVLLGLAGCLVFDPRIPGLPLVRLYSAEVKTGAPNQVTNLISILAQRAGLANRPQLYVIPSMTLSAFSTGSPDKPIIAVTEGLLRRLTLRETAGVLAHEIAHIRQGDLTVFKLGDWLSRLTPLMALTGVALGIANLIAASDGEQVISWAAVAALYLAPALSSGLQLALSRSREDQADVEAVALTGDPMGLASALKRMEQTTGSVLDDFRLPLSARRVPYPSLIRAHAPDSARIALLLAHEQRGDFEPLVIVEQPMVSLVGYGPGDMKARMRWPGLWY